MFDCVFITLVLPLIFAVCLLLLLAAIEAYCCFYGSISVYLSINIGKWLHFLIIIGTLAVIASEGYKE